MEDEKDDTAFLAELGQEMRTQDRMAEPDGPTHATARPLYICQQKVRDYGIDADYRDPDGWETEECDGPFRGSVPYVERWETVDGAISFTRRGIMAYIEANRHNLNEPRPYVASVPRRCHETVELMEILKRAAS